MRILRSTLILAAALSLVACESSTSPFDEPLFFQGEVDAENPREHFFTIAETATVRIELTEVQAVVADTGEPVDQAVVVAVFAGIPAADGSCPQGLRVASFEGDVSVLLLTPADRCLLVATAAILGEGTLAHYEITIVQNF